MTSAETPPNARDQVPFGIRLAGAWSGYFLIIAAAIAVVGWVLAKLGLVTVAFVTGVMVAALLQPLVALLVKRGVPRGWSALIAFLTGVGSLGLLLWFVIAQVIGSSDELSRQLTTGEESARNWLVDGPLGLDAATAEKYTTHISSTMSDSDIASQAGSYVGAVMGLAAGILLTLFCILFMLADDGRIWRWCVRLLPKKTHGYAEVAGAAGWRTLVVYMRSLVLLAVLNAVAMLPIMWFANVPLAIPMTVVIFLGSLIPLVGAFAAAGLLFVLALIGNGIVTAIVMVVALTVIIQLFGNLINPIILGKFVDLHPLVILLGVTGGAILGGAFGAFTAVPLIAVINNMVKVISRHRTELAAHEGEPDPADVMTEDQLEHLAQESL